MKREKMQINFFKSYVQGPGNRGGLGGVGPPLESGIYVVKFFLKNFLIYLDPLDKNRSQAPVDYHSQLNFQ